MVRTRPSAMTTPEPRRREPIPTTDGPTAPATAATASWSSSRTDMGTVPLWDPDAGLRVGRLGCYLRFAIYYRSRQRASPSPTIARDDPPRPIPPAPCRRAPSPPRSIGSATAGACSSWRRCSPVRAGSASWRVGGRHRAQHPRRPPRRLERSGIVVATPYSHRPPRMDYALTTDGRELAGALRCWPAGAPAVAAPGSRSATRRAARRSRPAGTAPPASGWSPGTNRTS